MSAALAHSGYSWAGRPRLLHPRLFWRPHPLTGPTSCSARYAAAFAGTCRGPDRKRTEWRADPVPEPVVRTLFGLYRLPVRPVQEEAPFRLRAGGRLGKRPVAGLLTRQELDRHNNSVKVDDSGP
ncbi:hypothetical protein [Nocardiopsis xinjiangensis]|uniref:hypothetical protein n=1 Tax=Nocardiopsis xinjiangensis TaxID=124285 RepID=UPI001268B0D2|nr:hypothetical protein [Nocardiopsis xinjiangensis]